MPEVDRLKVAGDAAEILERMGYTAVARKKEGVVTLQFWKVIDDRQYVTQRVVGDDGAEARALALVCDAEFRAAMSQVGAV